MYETTFKFPDEETGFWLVSDSPCKIWHHHNDSKGAWLCNRDIWKEGPEVLCSMCGKEVPDIVIVTWEMINT